MDAISYDIKNLDYPALIQYNPMYYYIRGALMLFNSVTFIIFFITVLLLYYILPHKLRWIMLLIASYIFYMGWRPELIILIIFSTFVNYFISLKISGSQDLRYRKRMLILSLVINFSVLFIFKYLVFINHTFMFIYNYFGRDYPIDDFRIILPMGISFYTFQAASYTIDVYRRTIEPEKNFFKLSLFITFFPQLVAGPIERADRLMPSLFEKRRFEPSNISMGAKIMIMGFFKKIVIADRVAVLVNTVYNSPQYFDGLSFIIATVMFAFQIYCDFSGYSDIAVGCAKTLGIDLMKNFERPYYASGIREFWRRWHISLSTWFKDYVYIPLGGNRVGKVRNCFNLFVTFLLSGIWHGANWTFAIWGALHGFYQIMEKLIRLPKAIAEFLPVKIINIFITFVLVSFAWIFFRANTLEDAYYIVTHLTSMSPLSSQYLYDTINALGLSMVEIIIACGSILLLLVIELFQGMDLKRPPFVFRFLFYYVIVVIILSVGVFGNANEFIYFQF